MIKEIDLKQLEAEKDSVDVDISKKDKVVANATKTTKKDKYVDPQTLTLSQKGWDMIRDHEKLRLSAYKIGDGKITIGWGHAEPIKTSKYKIGDKITKEEAQKIFINDVNAAANGARRMFSQWIEYRGHDIKVTQGQFDAIVSMMFNGGVSGFRKSNVAELLELGKYKDAANAISTFKISDDFPGLEERRKKEKELFNS
jgi:lysozyme